MRIVKQKILISTLLASSATAFAGGVVPGDMSGSGVNSGGSNALSGITSLGLGDSTNTLAAAGSLGDGASTVNNEAVSKTISSIDLDTSLQGLEVEKVTTVVSDIANGNGSGNETGNGNTLDGIGNNNGSGNSVDALSDSVEANNIGNVNGNSGAVKGYNTAQLGNTIKQLNNGQQTRLLKTGGGNKPL